MNEAKIMEMSLKELAEYHNDNAKKPVKKFGSKSAGQKKCIALLNGMNAQKSVKKKKKKKPATKSVKEAAKGALMKGMKKRGRSHTFGNTKITVLSENPKRDGSACHARYALYKKGQTADDYITAVEKNIGGTNARNLALADIRWDLKQGSIEMA